MDQRSVAWDAGDGAASPPSRSTAAACHAGGYASRMYLSPRRLLSSLARMDDGEPAGSMVGWVCISATFPSPDRVAAVHALLEERLLPSLGTKLFVRSPCGVRPAVLCAKWLRRSGEMAL
jgi:hypothetical protein